MDIKVKKENNILHISMIGELDEYTANFARDCLDNIININNMCKTIIFNMQDLSFMDSTGIGVLLGRYKKYRMNDINIFISNANRTVEKIFNMSGIYEIMPKIS
jgi:stage II sporulation protein AA (anti-sigma F factor antagonist)